MPDSDKKSRKQRVVVKTPFQVSVVQEDNSLRVVSSGHTDYKSAENWVKSNAKSELGLEGYVKFYIFHAKKQISVTFDENGAYEDMDSVVVDDAGNPSREEDGSEIIESPLDSLNNNEVHDDYEGQINSSDDNDNDGDDDDEDILWAILK